MTFSVKEDSAGLDMRQEWITSIYLDRRFRLPGFKSKGKGNAGDLYRGSMQSEDHRRTALQYLLVHWTLCRCQQYGAFSMKALARYQIILLGEQRLIRCEQLA